MSCGLLENAFLVPIRDVAKNNREVLTSDILKTLQIPIFYGLYLLFFTVG